MQPIEELIKERGEKHGGYSNVALTSQLIKKAMRHERTRALRVEEEEALDMIAHKIARICHGEPNQDDWTDVAGYALNARNVWKSKSGK